MKASDVIDVGQKYALVPVRKHIQSKSILSKGVSSTFSQLALERVRLPSCWQTMSCESVSSFLLRMAPTDPWRQKQIITACPKPTTPQHLSQSRRSDFIYLHGLRDLVDVLRFNDSPQVVLQDFGEIVLQLRTSEVGQDFLPVWRTLQSKTLR